jgi:hypothetical protein
MDDLDRFTTSDRASSRCAVLSTSFTICLELALIRAVPIYCEFSDGMAGTEDVPSFDLSAIIASVVILKDKT